MLSRNFHLFTVSLVLAISVHAQLVTPKYYIQEVRFEGNESFSDRELRRVIKLREPWFYKFSEFNRRSLKLDALTLKNFYASEGFLNASVKESFELVAKNRVDIMFRITEGRRSFLRSVEIKGNELVSTRKIKRILGLKINKPFDPIGVRQGFQRLEREYHKLGKLFIAVEENFAPGEDIELVLTIEEGPTVRIDEIIIDGLEGVDSTLVLRELKFQSGTVYDVELVDLTQRSIFETGLFSLVNIFPARSARGDDWVNLQIEVREFKEREFFSDGGYYLIESSSEGAEPTPGLGISGEFRDRNMWGTGSRFGVKGLLESPIEEIGTLFQENIYGVEASFFRLWSLGIRMPTTFRLFYKRGSGLTLGEQILNWTGGEVGVVRKFSEDSVLRGAVRWVRIFSSQAGELGDAQESGLRIAYRYRNVDNPIFPTRGSFLSVEPSLVSSVLGGTRNYYRVELDYRRYFANRSSWVLAFRVKLGRMGRFRTGAREIPDYAQLLLGGSTSLRGWDSEKFRTYEDEEGEKSGQEKGGLIKVLVNAELRIPVWRVVSINLFLDGGILADSESAFGSVLRNWLQFSMTSSHELVRGKSGWDYGVELSVASPLGPVRVYYAVPIAYAEAPKFNIGLMYAF